MSNENEHISLLLISIAGHQFALPTTEVRRVVRAVAVTPMPGAPSTMQGVIDLQGEVIPVVSARTYFGLPVREIQPDWCYVVLDSDAGSFVLIVDAVLGVISVEEDDFTYDESDVIPAIRPPLPSPSASHDSSRVNLAAQPDWSSPKIPIAVKVGGAITFLCYPEVLFENVKAGLGAGGGVVMPQFSEFLSKGMTSNPPALRQTDEARIAARARELEAGLPVP